MSPDLRVEFHETPAVVRLTELRQQAERMRAVRQKQRDDEEEQQAEEQAEQESEGSREGDDQPTPMTPAEQDRPTDPTVLAKLETVMLEERSAPRDLLEAGRRSQEQIRLQGRFEAAIRRIEQEVKRLEHAFSEEMAALESEVVKLALAIAEKVVGQKIESGLDISHLVEEGIGRVAAGVHDPKQITVRVSAADRDVLTAALGEQFDIPGRVKIEVDPKAPPSSCVIFCDMRQVVIDLEKELQRVRETLVGTGGDDE